MNVSREPTGQVTVHYQQVLLLVSSVFPVRYYMGRLPAGQHIFWGRSWTSCLYMDNVEEKKSSTSETFCGFIPTYIHINSEYCRAVYASRMSSVRNIFQQDCTWNMCSPASSLYILDPLVSAAIVANVLCRVCSENKNKWTSHNIYHFCSHLWWRTMVTIPYQYISIPHCDKTANEKE